MVTTKDILRLFWQSAWKYKFRVIGTFLTLPLALLGNSFLPALIASSVLERLASGHFNPNDVWGSFGGDILVYAAIVFMGAVVLWRIVGILIWRLEIRVQEDLHNRMFSHLMQLDTNFHANRFGGSLVSQVNKLAGAYVRVQDTLVFEFLPLAISIAFASFILWPRAPLYVLALLGLSAVFIVATIIISRIVRKYSEAEAAASNKQTGILADAISNIAAIKSFSARKHEQAHYASAVKSWTVAERAVMNSTLVRQTFYASITTSLGVAALALAVVSVTIFHADVSTVFLVVTYTGMVTQGLWEFSSHSMRTFTHALGDAKAMTEILEITPEVTDKPNPEPPRIQKGAIVFNDVTFTHADAKKNDVLFRNLNLTIPAGKKIGLIGRSGSGKTTLTRLLLRFSDIDGGAITIDGQNIADVTQDDLRRSIAYVPQEPLLFHRTLRENIAYGRPDATTDEIKDAAHKAHAAEFIDKLPNGYETEVGERGVKLSGGQRQRIAIARAILKDAPILVLDEATSALDSESEKLIQAALWELMQGRTAIVIAHRLSTIQRMDEIVVLENGAILEKGSHQTLLKKGGVYAELWAHQSGGFIEE
jgi:ATP-binding cassette, subfamily B, bacterial